MKVSAHVDCVHVTLTTAEWLAKPPSERAWLTRHALQVVERPSVFLAFDRKAWQSARHFFPQLKTILPRTWQNV